MSKIVTDIAGRSRRVDCCARCHTPQDEAAMADERQVAGESCRYCIPTPPEQGMLAVAKRHEAIRCAVTPLPGSRCADQFKPVNVPAECDGKTMLAVLRCLVGHLSEAEWMAECDRGRIQDLQGKPVEANRRVRAGERYRHLFPNVIEPEVDGRVDILHEEEAFIVLNKPAPLPMHAGGRYYRNTLQHILNAVYYPQQPLPVHRLDASTTGLVVAARTGHFAGKLQTQFVRREVGKRYLVRVQGQPKEDAFYCDAPISARSGRLGSRVVDWVSGRSARTEFRVLRRNSDGTSLIDARPLTGRTHQIRVHLWHLGFPVFGDPAYLAGGRCGGVQTLGLSDPPLCLHAWEICFLHPLTGQPVAFKAPLPEWAMVIGAADFENS